MIADRSLGLPLGEKLGLGKDVYEAVGLTKDMVGTSGDGLCFFTVSDDQIELFEFVLQKIVRRHLAPQWGEAGAEVGCTRSGLCTNRWGTTPRRCLTSPLSFQAGQCACNSRKKAVWLGEGLGRSGSAVAPSLQIVTSCCLRA